MSPTHRPHSGTLESSQAALGRPQQPPPSPQAHNHPIDTQIRADSCRHKEHARSRSEAPPQPKPASTAQTLDNGPRHNKYPLALAFLSQCTPRKLTNTSPHAHTHAPCTPDCCLNWPSARGSGAISKTQRTTLGRQSHETHRWSCCPGYYEGDIDPTQSLTFF
jgi:hypothetical protein